MGDTCKEFQLNKKIRKPEVFVQVLPLIYNIVMCGRVGDMTKTLPGVR
jgi:hypothetical protein